MIRIDCLWVSEETDPLRNGLSALRQHILESAAKDQNLLVDHSWADGTRILTIRGSQRRILWLLGQLLSSEYIYSGGQEFGGDVMLSQVGKVTFRNLTFICDTEEEAQVLRTLCPDGDVSVKEVVISYG